MVNATLHKNCDPKQGYLPREMLDKGFKFTVKSACIGNAIVAISAGVDVPRHMGWVERSRMGGCR